MLGTGSSFPQHWKKMGVKAARAFSMMLEVVNTPETVELLLVVLVDVAGCCADPVSLRGACVMRIASVMCAISSSLLNCSRARLTQPGLLWGWPTTGGPGVLVGQ